MSYLKVADIVGCVPSLLSGHLFYCHFNDILKTRGGRRAVRGVWGDAWVARGTHTNHPVD